MAAALALGTMVSRPAYANDVSNHADAYIAALRATPGGVTSLGNLTNVYVPQTGAVPNNIYQAIISMLFHPDGSTTPAWTDPVGAAKAVVAGDTYLKTLRTTPGALVAVQTLNGVTFPSTGPLNPTTLDFLFTQLFDSNGNPTTAYVLPAEAAQATVNAVNYLTVLRQDAASLSALKTLTGQSLPSSGPLSVEQVQFLFQQLFNADGTKSVAFSNPQGAAQGIVHAVAYLSALRNDPAALGALKTLTGASFPTSGPLSGAQIDLLFEQLFNADGTQAVAYSNPAAATQSLVHAVAYLNVLRQNPAALAGIASLTGTTLPASGALTPLQINFLFQQLFNSDGTHSGAYNDPDGAAQGIIHAVSYLNALRLDPAGLAAVATLTGQSLPNSGPLNLAQINFLFQQLYNADGTTSVAYDKPAEGVQALVHAVAYLDALRKNPSALAGVATLTGQSLPASGALSLTQIDFLFKQLFNADGSHSAAYDKPSEAAESIAHAVAYLNALRQDPTALAGIATLTGTALPANGPLSLAQIQFLFSQIFNADGSHAPAYDNPAEAVQSVSHAVAFLNALRKEPGALAGVAALTGQTLPAQGPLTAQQIQFLFEQIFNADGSRSIAYDDPAEGAKGIVHAAAYLDALRKTTGALQGLAQLSGKTLPVSGPLTNAQIEFLFQQLFDAKGQHTSAYDKPLEAADAIVHALAYLDALRKTPGALEALEKLTGHRLPASGTLSAEEIQFLFQQLFKADGSKSVAYDHPEDAAAALVSAYTFWQVFVKNPEALAALQRITGRTLPAQGPLSVAEIDFLFSQLFDANGNKTNAFFHPEDAALGIIAADKYVSALRTTPGALDAFAELLGQKFPSSGPLSFVNLTFVFQQLYGADGKPTLAYTNPARAAQAVVSANNYLRKLRETGVIKDLNFLTGQKLPDTGLLSPDQIQFLFKQLFEASGNTSKAFDDPESAAKDIHHARLLVDALRHTTNGTFSAVGALNALTGAGIPTGDVALSDPNDSANYESLLSSRLKTIFQILYILDKDGNPTVNKRAWDTPEVAAHDVLAAWTFLKALRSTPGALEGVQQLAGFKLPESGFLSDADLTNLMGLLFDPKNRDGLSQAYNDPYGAAAIFAQQGSSSGHGGLWLGLGLIGAGLAGAMLFGGVPAKLLGLGLALGGIGVLVHSGHQAAKKAAPHSPSTAVTASGTKVSPVVVSPVEATSDQVASKSVSMPVTGGVDLTKVTVADPSSKLVGPATPRNAYIPLFSGQGDPTNPAANSRASRAAFDQFRWLVDAQSSDTSAASRQAAVRNAAASNKNVGVADPTRKR